MNRREALARLRAQAALGRPIIGAGAGTGLSAKCAEAGGADLIIIYNSGRYRMAGRGSLAGLVLATPDVRQKEPYRKHATQPVGSHGASRPTQVPQRCARQ